MDWTTTLQDPGELRDAFGGWPDARYRPIPGWWWSGEKVTEERLLWQLDRLHELGMGGIIVTGLARHGPAGGSVADDPAFLSDEWFRLFRIVLERCRELGMGAITMSRFQTGAPIDAPRLLEEHPEFRGERIMTRDGVLVQPFGFDYGNRRALEAFIAPGTMNHRIHDEVADLLGDVLCGMFEDEVIAFPRWAPTFADDFRELKGYDPPISAFDTDIGPSTPAVRWDLFDVATTRVERAYTAMTAEWVAEHNLLAGYDQMSRRGTPILSSAYYFDPFRTMTWANAPGADTMGDIRFHLSIADLTGAPRVWFEAGHSHGWGMTLEQQARLLYTWGREGANLYHPHGIYYAGRAFWWEWAPPEMGFKQPYARHYPAFAAECGRLMMALAAGHHVPEVAVLYPLSTVWADTTGYLEWGKDAQAAEETYLALFGKQGAPSGQEPERPESPGLLAEAGYDRIVVDEPNVDTFDVPIVVAACRCLKTTTVEALLAGAEADRTVVIVEPAPEWSAEVGSDDPDFRALVERLRAVAVVVDSPEEALTALPPPRVDGLKSQWRRVGDLDLLFVTGTGQVRLRDMAGHRPERWDLRTGTITTIGARIDGDDLVIDLAGPANLLALPPGTPEPPSETNWEEVPLPEVWDCEYLPWGENRWGDYRLPANEGTPPTERRTFAFREGDDDWHTAPVVPEDMAHPILEPEVDLGFEDRMGQARSRPAPHERLLGDGWREVVSTYGPKAVVTARTAPDATDEPLLAEYSERLGVEDILLSTPIGLKGWVEPVKVDLGEGGGTVVTWGHVPESCDTHLVIEGAGVLTITLDDRAPFGPVEGGLLTIPVHLEAGWHRLEITAEYRGPTGRDYVGYRSAPRTRLAWAFTEPYRRDHLALWGGQMMHPDYKGAQEPRRFRRTVVVPEPAQVRAYVDASGPCMLELPDRLEPGEHVIEAFAGGSVQPGRFTCELELEMDSGTVVIGTDDRWETLGAGEQVWLSAKPVGMMGALSSAGTDTTAETERRSPLLDVAWLEGPTAVAGHVADAWADTPGVPPPAWFCFLTAPGARSMTLPIVGEVHAWIDGDLVEVVGNRLRLREHARVALRVQAPPGHRGAACFREHPVLELGDGTIRTSVSWHRQGLDCFSGVILHRTEVDVDGAGEAVLDLGDVAGSVSVRVNGHDAGTLFAPPWTLPVTLRAGANTIELEVANTLGPMVARGVPTPFGPEDQRTSGILARPVLRVPT